MAGATSGRAGIVEFVTYCVFSMGYGFSMGIYLLYFIYIFFLYIHVHVHVQMCPDAHVQMSMSMSIFMSMCVCECLIVSLHHSSDLKPAVHLPYLHAPATAGRPATVKYFTSSVQSTDYRTLNGTAYSYIFCIFAISVATGPVECLHPSVETAWRERETRGRWSSFAASEASMERPSDRGEVALRQISTTP